ncbi:MAG: integral rane sensor signal transduction histidine kinase [Firmicutes bacterium]|nr:integral rane sensor signal transduction histidine kinase [Bacillota bacterium]
MNSITYRITGLMFLAVALTVILLIYLANVQMTGQFKEYLVVQQMEMSQSGIQGHINDGTSTMTVVMGPLEETFLASVHNSLIWVGLAILAVGLAASYALARSITVPLRNLSKAAEQIAQGNFEQTVPIETKDEVGHLAAIFNRMAEVLATNTKLRRQLLANIAHELRTPLAVIQGHLEGMIDGVIEPSKDQLSSLHEEAIRLNRLIKELRDLSLAEVRQLALEKGPTDINQLISRVVNMLRPIADEKNIHLGCFLAEEIPDVTVDNDRMNQVFYNILVNAIRYSPVYSEVQVTTSLEETGQWLIVSIRDNGPGIAAEDVLYVFDHFYRGDKSRDRKSGGSGLGLAIVKQLVEIHGGQVAVNSEVGKGSIFEVRIPLDKEGRYSV